MNLTRIISRTVPIILLLLLCRAAHAQVNSGSNGSDGAFNPTTNIVINMADHPNGIYQYTSVNISNVVTVTFIPNANNTPVVWLVQSNCVISGQITLNGQSAVSGVGASGGPGGYAGGNGGSVPTPGQGPGGGPAGVGSPASCGGVASYGSLGSGSTPGSIYGNVFLLPLIGGSGGGGGGGNCRSLAGGGGGGAILIAAPSSIQLNGAISASGGYGTFWYDGSGGAGYGAGGSAGAVRLIANIISGTGSIAAGVAYPSSGGLGRVRFDTYQNSIGRITGVFTQGYQPIIIPTPGQEAQLTITSVGGVAVSASPTGTITTPDAVLSAQQNNPISVVVHCSNIPLNTQITVSVRPANGSVVSATGNNTGTLASSTATVSITMPRGGGIIYATAAN
jgi:hypothetical protein